MSQPLQIVSTGFDTDQFVLNEDNLNSILTKVPDGTKVAVVSVVGAFRTGKSFLLNFFLRYLRCSEEGDLSEDWMTIEGEALLEGNLNDVSSGKKEDGGHHSFAWRGGQERQTTGIWMWSEPFLRTPKGSSEPLAILLMDTQGMFDNETSMALTAQIFGLSTFVSSFQIYNVEKRIQEDNLQHLALFSEYGRIAVKPKTTNETVSPGVVERTASGSGGEASSSTVAATMVPDSAAKPFQRLQFLVRDWPNFDADWDDENDEDDGKSKSKKKTDDDDDDVELEDVVMVEKAENDQESIDPKTQKKNNIFQTLRDEMRTYFRDVIKDRGLADLQSTREQISRCFSTVDCFLLPHPGLAVTKKNFNGSLNSIGSFFKGMMNRYVRMIFDEELEAKVIHRRAITAPELRTYFEVYVKMFQADGKSFPKAMTMLDATAEASNRNAQDLALNIYNDTMDSILKDGSGGRGMFMKEITLRGHHETAEAAAMAEFASVATLGSDASITAARQILQEMIETDRLRYFELNEMRNPFRDLEMYAVPIFVAIVGWGMATLVDVSCSHTYCEITQSSFEKLYLFCAFGVLAMALRYPFTDIIMYTVPLTVAAASWFVATILNVSCSTQTCNKMEFALKKVYLYIIFCTIVLAYKNFSGSFAFFKDFFPVLDSTINIVGTTGSSSESISRSNSGISRNLSRSNSRSRTQKTS